MPFLGQSLNLAKSILNHSESTHYRFFFDLVLDCGVFVFSSV